MRAAPRDVALLCFLLLSLLSPLSSVIAASYSLQDGVRQIIESSYQETVNLAFNVTAPQYELRLTLTVFTGQPDLFVGLAPNPALSNYTWRSFDAGHTAIIVRHSDPKACTAPCTYYMSLIDYWNPAFYSILATQSVNATVIPISLFSPLPMTGVLDPNSGGLAWYSFHTQPFGPAGAAHDLRFLLSPIQGDGEMIVSTSQTFILSILPRVQTGAISGRVYTEGSNTAWLTNGFGLDGQVLGIHTVDPGFCVSECDWFLLVWPRLLNVTVEFLLQSGFVYDGPQEGGIDPIPHRLVNHVPLTRVLFAGQQESFVITALAGGTIPRSRLVDLVISHTKVIGLSRMLVSRGRCSNNSDSSDWVSDIFHSGVFKVGNAFNPALPNVSWCATVIAETNTTFTITGSLSLIYYPDRAPNRLLNGIPFNDALGDHQIRYYVHYQPLADRVTVSVSRKFGDFMAFMCLQNWTVPTPVNFSIDCFPVLNGDGLAAMDTPWLPAGRYLIAVQGTRGYSFDVDYTITGSTMYAQQTLQASVPLPAIITPQPPLVWDWTFNATFYQFYWPYDLASIPYNQQRNLTVTCSLYSGHATVYGSDLTFPTWWNYTWISDRTHMDSIIIPVSALRRGWYFFTVVAESSSTFSLAATTYLDVQLQPGLPANGFVRRGELHYYWLTLPQFLSTNVTINLVPIRGFASLLIANNSVVPRYPTPSDPSSWTLKVNDPFTASQIAFIPHLDWCRNGTGRGFNADNGARCRYVIAVYGEEDTRYQLTAITPASTQVLQAGLPQPGFIGAVYRGSGQPYQRSNPRYQFFVPSRRCNVSLSLTTLLDEDLYNTTNHAPLSLFISRKEMNITADPLFTFHDPSQATIWFDDSDADFRDGGMEGFYYVEVVGSFGAVFTLGLTIDDRLWTAKVGSGTAGRSNASALILLDGQPQRMTVQPVGWFRSDLFGLFQYDLPVSRHYGFIQFIAEVVAGGEVEIFARNDGLVPSRDPSDTAQWWSGSANTISELIIPPLNSSSPRYCDQLSGACSFLISVYCRSPFFPISTFQISVSDEGPRTELIDGVPLDSLILQPKSWRFLSFWAVGAGTQNRSLIVEMDVGSGFNHNVQLYAAYDQLPDQSSAHGERYDDRHTRLTVFPARRGQWIIGVYNGDNSLQTVSVVATVDNTVLLLEGVPQFYQMGNSESEVTFRYNFVSDGTRPFLFHLAMETGNPPIFFFVNTDGTRPTRDSYQFNTTSTAPGPFRNTIYIGPGNRLYRNSTTIYVLVVYVHLRAANPFTVVASSSSLSQLVDGENSADTGLAPGRTAYFAYEGMWGDSVQLFVGLVRTFVARDDALVVLISRANGPLPTNTSYQYRLDVAGGSNTGSRVISGMASGQYKIAVTNVGTDFTSFTLLVSATSVISIPDVEPVPGACGARRLLFSSLVPPSDTDFILYIRPTVYADFRYSAGLEVLISTSLSPRPSRNSSQWIFSPLFWNSSVTIARADMKLALCQQSGPCTLYISIDCLAPSSILVQYTVTTQEQRDILPLQPFDSLPSITTLYPKHYAVFILTAPLLYIQLTPCLGDAALYLSDATLYPDRNHYTASFTQSNSLPFINVGPELLKNDTQYYLSVFPYNNATVVYSMDVLPFNPTQDGDILPPRQGTSIVVTGNSIRWWPVQVNPRWQGLDYAVSYQLYASADDSTERGRVLYTRCGLARAGHWIGDYHANSLTPGSDGSLTVSDIAVPDPSRQHSINLVGVFSFRDNATNSYQPRPFNVVYTPATVLGSTGNDESNKQTTLMAEILVAIFLPLFVLALLIAIYLRRRNLALEEELSVELPDVEQSLTHSGARADSTARRQRRRERAAGSAGGSGDSTNGSNGSSGGFLNNLGRGRGRAAAAAAGGENETGAPYASLLNNDHLGDFK